MALAVPFVLALGGLFWVVDDSGDSSGDAAAPSGEERTVSSDRDDPDGSAPGTDAVTPTTASVGVAAGDAVAPADEQERAVDPGASGSAGSPGSTTPPGGTNPNQPNWSSTTTTRPSTTTTRPPAPTTTTSPHGLLGSLLDALGLG